MLSSSDNMSNYLNSLIEKNGNNTLIDSKDVSTKYTTDVIASLSFGIETNSFEEPVPAFYTNSKTWFVIEFYYLFTIKIANDEKTTFKIDNKSLNNSSR